MSNNNTQISEIKKLKTKINHHVHLSNTIDQAGQNFKKFFPNHSFGSVEKEMIAKQISVFQEEIKKLSSTITKGEVLDLQTVSDTVLEAWGRTKIKITVFDLAENEEEFDYAIEVFQNGCGLTFDKSELTIVEYYLTTSNRSQLYLVRAYLAPGFAFATFDTGKVAWGTEVLTNSKFLGQVAAEVDCD